MAIIITRHISWISIERRARLWRRGGEGFGERVSEERSGEEIGLL